MQTRSKDHKKVDPPTSSDDTPSVRRLSEPSDDEPVEKKAKKSSDCAGKEKVKVFDCTVEKSLEEFLKDEGKVVEQSAPQVCLETEGQDATVFTLVVGAPTLEGKSSDVTDFSEFVVGVVESDEAKDEDPTPDQVTSSEDEVAKAN